MHPKLGMEIEANWPSYRALNPELIAAFENAATKANIPGGGTSIYSAFMGFTGGRTRQQDSTTPAIKALFDHVPEKFWFPENWDKGHDSGVEGRYDHPAESLSQAVGWTTRYAQWLRDFGFTAFSSAGTHVHLGHLEWLDETFGKASEGNPLRTRAEALMWAYFATREQAIFEVTSRHRVTCGSATPYFVGREYAVAGRLISQLPAGNGRVYTTYSDRTAPDGFRMDAATPLWAMHNHLLTNFVSVDNSCAGGFYGASVCNRRKGLPTLEFRFFAGTHATTALVGYLKLLHTMFLNATKVVIGENLKAQSESSLSHPILVNPFTFTSDDLKKEISDPWLLKWIDLTVKNKGEPITDEIPEPQNIPQALAAAA